MVAAVLVGWSLLGDVGHPTRGDEGSSEPQTTTGDGAVGPLERGREVETGGLDPGLVAAFEEARLVASTAGVELGIVSGYRSADEQLALLETEIAERGSREEALHWVFPPDRSMHVRGLAIDLDSGPGADWLQVHGANYGLCRTLEWEWWHFEWRRRWQSERRCPAPATTPDEAPPP